MTIDIVNRCSYIRVSIKNYEDRIKEETSGKRKDRRWNASHPIDNVTGISIYYIMTNIISLPVILLLYV
jgi:hypothetical protein